MIDSFNSENRKSAFIITAAGSGTRMGEGLKKEFRLLDGKPVLTQIIETFIDTSLFDYGLVTCKAGTQEQTATLTFPIAEKLEKLNKPLLFCEGGAERQESVYLGLKYLAKECPDLLENGYVLIHDGARPWVNTSLITRVAEGCIIHQACAPVTVSVDAMKQVNGNGIITGHLPRKETFSVQTPQGFSFGEIIAAHARAEADGRHYIDDTEIFSRYEGDVYTVEGCPDNRKITYPGDLPE